MSALKLALRTLFRKTPFVTAVAIVSLALGIGANVAIFSIFHQMLLRPLPVEAPDRLVNLGAPGPKPGTTSCSNAGDCTEVFSYAMFRDLERNPGAFSGLAGHRNFGANLSFKGQTLSGQGWLVSGSYFPLLGLTPSLGRLLGPDDDRTPGGHFVVVLSHAYWRTRFNASPTVLNEVMTINGHPMTIVGVAPAGFEGTTLGSTPEVFVPLTMRSEMVPGWTGFDNRRNYWVYVFGRLKPDATIEQAGAAINVTYEAIINDVEAPLQKGMSDQTLARFRARKVTLVPGPNGQSSIRAEAGPPLALLLSVTGIVLLIACANIANLLLARAATRATEMAVRLSIGAGRRHIVGQLLLESCLLGVLGGALGLVVAHWTLQAIVALLPAEASRTIHAQLDWAVMLFAAGLSIGTGFLFGLFPALHSSRPDLVTSLKGQAGQPSGARAAARFRTSLATVQIALSMMLLVAAGLFTRSLLNVSRVDLGLRTDHLVTFAVSPELNGYTPAQAVALFERLEEDLSALPGVTNVTASMVPLISGSNWGSSVRVQGFDAGPDTDRDASFNLIGPGFFRTMGIPLMAGREFTSSDVLDAPKVVVVNEAFTKKFNLGRDAVGKMIGSGQGDDLDSLIVGVVQDAKYSEVKRAIPPQFFRPYRQDDSIGAVAFYVRTSTLPESLMDPIRRTVSRLDANLPVEELKLMDTQVRENVFLDRFITTLSSAFATLATLLAAVGLYGVLAYTIAQRTREFGLRMALGADPGRVRRMVLERVGWMTLVGGIAGLAAALAIGRLARSLLFELEGHDPTVLVGSVVLLTLVSLGAGLVPAIRASRIDPMRALRYE